MMRDSSRLLRITQVLFLGALLALTGCPEGDPCDGVNCDAGQECIDGVCVPIEESCTPLSCDDIAGIPCGIHDDGCDGTINCGECEGDFICEEGFCIDPDCEPDCAGLECGPDPLCGRSCGTCDAGFTCEGGVCVPEGECVPDCTGLECGPDPVCGISCGECDPGYRCVGGTCIDEGECGDQFSGNHTSETAAGLTLPFARTELMLCGPDAEDWFSFSLEGGSLYSFASYFSHDDGDIDMRLYADPTDTSIRSAASASDDELIEYAVPFDAAGTYYLQVYLYDTHILEQPYELEILQTGTVECFETDDCGADEICVNNQCVSCDEDQFAGNDSWDTAAAITLPVDETNLSLCGGGAEDWFVFNLDADQVYSFSALFTHADGNIDMRLYKDPEETAVATGTSLSDDEEFAYVVPAGEGGTYYLRVWLSTWAYMNSYDLIIEGLGAPECDEHADCPTLGEVCERYICVMSECTTTVDCEGYGLVCADGANYCIECNAVDDCPNADDFTCTNNVCELDCATDQFAGNHSHETAAAVTLPFNETGLTLCGRRAEDWFSFSLSPGQVVTVEATFAHADGDVDIYLRHADAPTSTLASGSSMTDNETMTYTVPADGGGTYYVIVYLYSSYTQTYGLTIMAQ